VEHKRRALDRIAGLDFLRRELTKLARVSRHGARFTSHENARWMEEPRTRLLRSR
jgi:hypothetical protein